MKTFRIPTVEYRALPIPFVQAESGRTPKLGTCYVNVADLPSELRDWLQVNPRIPRLDKRDHLKGPVAKAIVETLLDEPEMMCVRNNGITLLVDSAEFKKEQGGQGMLALNLSDPSAHGIVNGGHTFAAIQEAAAHPDRPTPWDASVRLHIYENISSKHIADIAEGLNRSLQVDDASLENLQGTFDAIKKALAGKPGAESIAYRQGDSQDVDIQFVLTIMAMLNLSHFPDRKTHPNKLFGQPKAVLQQFVEEANQENPSYAILLPKLHDILVLSDLIQREAAAHLGKLKVKNSKTANRVGSTKHKDIPAHFAGGTLGGHIPLGWVYPMLASFRANVDTVKWAAGTFAWLDDPKSLLKATIEEMCEVIKQEHTDNKEKPGEVGRKEAAYRGCYSVVAMELATRGKLTPAG